MAVTVAEFPGLTDQNGEIIQIVDGQPIAITPGPATLVLGSTTRIIKITGSGSITWPNALVESFSGTEFRGVNAGETLVLA